MKAKDLYDLQIGQYIIDETSNSECIVLGTFDFYAYQLIVYNFDTELMDTVVSIRKNIKKENKCDRPLAEKILIKLHLSNRLSKATIEHYTEKFNFEVMPIMDGITYHVTSFHTILYNYYSDKAKASSYSYVHHITFYPNHVVVEDSIGNKYTQAYSEGLKNLYKEGYIVTT